MSRRKSASSIDKVTVDVNIDSDGVGLIEFNRPKELNSFIARQYGDVVDALTRLAEDPKCVVAVLTGNGPYYSSGHDLRAMQSLIGAEDLEKALTDATNAQAKRFVRAFIDFPKPLICAVNGGCFGISATVTQLCDIVYASESAFFETPFMRLGFCAEGCSSLLFPAVMGPSKANEMLLLGRRLTAQEAERVRVDAVLALLNDECGFVASVFPDTSLRSEVMLRAKQMASYPAQALQVTKRLVRHSHRELLHKVNDLELEELVKRFMSEECMEAMVSFAMSQGGKAAAKKEKNDKSDTVRSKL